jgi:hypothetical protein
VDTAVMEDWPAPSAPPLPPAGRFARWFPVLLACMVACGTVYAAAAPRSDSYLTRRASLGAFLQDVDRGLVHSVYVDHDNLVWRPKGARTWSTGDMHGFGFKAKPIDGLAAVMTEAATVNPDAHLVVRPEHYGWWWALRGLGVLGSIGAFLLLLAGPQPRRATKWGWFWLFSLGRSAGLGILAFLLLGARPARATADHGLHRADRERWDGFSGFAVAFVGSLLLAILGGVARHAVLPDRSGTTSYSYDNASPR